MLPRMLLHEEMKVTYINLIQSLPHASAFGFSISWGAVGSFGTFLSIWRDFSMYRRHRIGTCLADIDTIWQHKHQDVFFSEVNLRMSGTFALDKGLAREAPKEELEAFEYVPCLELLWRTLPAGEVSSGISIELFVVVETLLTPLDAIGTSRWSK